MLQSGLKKSPFPLLQPPIYSLLFTHPHHASRNYESALVQQGMHQAPVCRPGRLITSPRTYSPEISRSSRSRFPKSTTTRSFSKVCRPFANLSVSIRTNRGFSICSSTSVGMARTVSRFALDAIITLIHVIHYSSVLWLVNDLISLLDVLGRLAGDLETHILLLLRRGASEVSDRPES